jgi:hypothetical protein
MTRREITIDGDHTVTTAGQFGCDSSQVPSVILAIRTTRGSVPSAPTFGRRPRVGKVTSISAKVEEKALRDALSHLVEGGRIWDLSVVCTPVLSRGVIESRISFFDGTGPQVLDV